MNRQVLRVLVYGFGPYRQFRSNITAQVIDALPAMPGLQKMVFPVRFHRLQFIRALEKHRPDVILGLGQSSRRNIELETRAANRRRAIKIQGARPIRRRGPRWLPTTLGPEIDRRVKRSRSAGDYVCNFSMYVMLDQIRRTRGHARFGFVHLPHHADSDNASRWVARVIRKITAPMRRRRSS